MTFEIVATLYFAGKYLFTVPADFPSQNKVENEYSGWTGVHWPCYIRPKVN